MGNYEEKRTANSVEIVEIEATSTTEDHDRHSICSKSDAAGRPRNPYFYGAWGLVLVMIGLGTLWIFGFSPGAGPERFRTDIIIDSSTGTPVYEPADGVSAALGNLAGLAPGLFFIGLCGALVLLIVQGVIRQKQAAI